MTLPRGDGEVVSNTRVAVRVRPMTSIERDLGAGRCLNTVSYTHLRAHET